MSSRSKKKEYGYQGDYYYCLQILNEKKIMLISKEKWKVSVNMLTIDTFLFAQYQKEVARLVFGDRKDAFGHKMLVFARQWMKFVMTKCERGRGTRPRYGMFSLTMLWC